MKRFGEHERDAQAIDADRRRCLKRWTAEAVAGVSLGTSTGPVQARVERVACKQSAESPSPAPCESTIARGDGDGFEAVPRSAIDGFVEERFTAAGSTRSIFRRGRGPVVVLMHELPGLTPQTTAFATELACHGFEVVLPLLFGVPNQSATDGAFRSIGLCVRKEFHCLGSGRSSEIVEWLRPLCRALHARAGGPGIGVVGMCFSGGFVLSMMLEPSVLAPVSAQPALPLWPRGAVDIPDGDLKAVLDLPRAKPLLLLRFDEDRISSSSRLKTLETAFGERGLLETFIVPGKGHSTLVYDYDAARARHCDPREAVARHLTSLLKVAVPEGG